MALVLVSRVAAAWKKINGFFIESGAYDGEHLSNTLFLERFRNWTGLLIEPNPSLFLKLLRKNRKSFAVNACLSTKDYPSVETFSSGKGACFGRILDHEGENFQNQTFKVKCYPLISILQAINRYEVDYFSLDIEGAEEGVLSKIPWEKVNIKIISIEHNKWRGGKLNLKHFMEKRGYKYVKEISDVGVAPDLIFEKKTQDLGNGL
ncbi:protein Star-like [Ruditapes philippinarum]|uniref:protein Star-like n=1 Tax=Ruditapes philippinarum TaxID=129788 RepID=UPI00295BEBAF|nr:protein Star-like [Ruditapes philippinarum]